VKAWKESLPWFQRTNTSLVNPILLLGKQQYCTVLVVKRKDRLESEAGNVDEREDERAGLAREKGA